MFEDSETSTGRIGDAREEDDRLHRLAFCRLRRRQRLSDTSGSHFATRTVEFKGLAFLHDWALRISSSTMSRLTPAAPQRGRYRKRDFLGG